jgi:hypothetical protein
MPTTQLTAEYGASEAVPGHVATAELNQVQEAQEPPRESGVKEAEAPGAAETKVQCQHVAQEAAAIRHTEAAKARRKKEEAELVRNKARMMALASSHGLNMPPAPEIRVANSEHHRTIELRERAIRERLKRMGARKDHRSQGSGASCLPGAPLQPPRRSQTPEGDEQGELDSLRAMLARCKAHDQAYHKQDGWDSRPFKAVPYPLKGMHPLCANDPWAQGVRAEWMRERLRPSSSLATFGLYRLDDGMNDDIATLFNRRKREERSVAARQNRQPWDTTIWHYTPPALRGMKPTTPEPWARDSELLDELNPSGTIPTMDRRDFLLLC